MSTEHDAAGGAVTEEQLLAACTAFGALEGERIGTGSVVPPPLSKRIEAALQASRSKDPLLAENERLRAAAERCCRNLERMVVSEGGYKHPFHHVALEAKRLRAALNPGGDTDG